MLKLAVHFEAGGKEYRYIECPNDSPEWLAALADFSVLQIADWPTAPAIERPAPNSHARLLGAGCQAAGIG